MPITLNGSAGVTTNSGAIYDGIQRGTAVASTSGTSIDFTSIPSWVKRITVMFQGVSTNGSSLPQIQLGTSGGIVTSGYLGAQSYLSGGTTGQSNLTSGLAVGQGAGSSHVRHGLISICNVNGNNWASSSQVALSNQAELGIGSSSISLSGTLTTVRITTVNGTDTFDAGSINILYE